MTTFVSQNSRQNSVRRNHQNVTKPYETAKNKNIIYFITIIGKYLFIFIFW